MRIARGNPAVIEEQLRRVGGVNPELGQLAAPGKARRVGRHDDQGDALVAGIAGSHGSGDEIGDRAVGDEGLGAVDDEVVPIDVPVDLEGTPRPVGPAFDVGAYEGAGTVFADGFESGDTGSWSQATNP